VVGLDGGRLKGWRREARVRTERGAIVRRSWGSQLADRRRAGGSCLLRFGDASITAQWWQKAEEEKGSLHGGGGVLLL
jgi:hypothetical protein